MMVNNFNMIGDYLRRENPTEFYFIQIIKRKKDNPGMSGSENKVIKEYSVFSRDVFERLESEIKHICDENNARAYIRLSRRDSRDIAKEMLVTLAQKNLTGDFSNLKNIYSTAVGVNKGLDKLWIVDIDGDRLPEKYVTIEYLIFISQHLVTIEPVGKKIVLILPTKNGIHIITSPFNLERFKTMFPGVDVHKNNPTLLYCP